MLAKYYSTVRDLSSVLSYLPIIDPSYMKPTTPVPRFEDDAVPFELGKLNGYYTVGDRYFLWKMLAYSEAARTGEKLQWHFHDEVWKKTDWRTPPALDLPALYRIRAEQLRQKYDYIILSWSGGADSTTVLDTFLQNNIRLDEVVVAWGVRASSGKYTVSATDTRAENYGSEWDFAIRPKLEWMRTHRPDIKITLADWSDDMKVTDDSENVLKVTLAHCMTGFLRAREIDKIIQDRSTRANNVCVVFGIEPVRTDIINDTYLATFFFDWFSENRSSLMPDGTPRKIEYFYWSPDLPEICVAQAHEVMRFLRAYPSMKKFFSRVTIGRDGEQLAPNPGNIEADRIIKKTLFYPTYNPKTFQASKNVSHFAVENFKWMYTDPQFPELNHTYGGVLESVYRTFRPDDFVTKDGQRVRLAVQRTKHNIVGKIDPGGVPDETERARYLKAYLAANEIVPFYDLKSKK